MWESVVREIRVMKKQLSILCSNRPNHNPSIRGILQVLIGNKVNIHSNIKSKPIIEFSGLRPPNSKGIFKIFQCCLNILLTSYQSHNQKAPSLQPISSIYKYYIWIVIKGMENISSHKLGKNRIHSTSKSITH